MMVKMYQIEENNPGKETAKMRGKSSNTPELAARKMKYVEEANVEEEED